MPNNYPFPNIQFDLGTVSPFVKDVQRALGIVESGVYDFLTMCHVVVHKFHNGLNHNDPTVGAHTWASIFSTDRGQQVAGEVAHGGGAAAELNQATPEGVAIVGQIPRTENPAAPVPVTAAPTTTGTTIATDENIPVAAQPDTNPDKPRTDQPTVTAAEQQAQGGAAGGVETHPTDTKENVPDFTPQPATPTPDPAATPDQNPPTV